jgi:hypothetical protein
MSYQLVLYEPVRETPKKGEKGVGEKVFFRNLPADSKVYFLYYPHPAVPNKELEKKLRAFGESTGKNLFVNLGTLGDDSFDTAASMFGINSTPVIIVTAEADLASHPVEYKTAYAKLEGKILDSPDSAIDCLNKLFVLFIQGRIAEALRIPGKYNEKALLSIIKNVISKTLKGIEINIEFLGCKLGVKRAG